MKATPAIQVLLIASALGITTVAQASGGNEKIERRPADAANDFRNEYATTDFAEELYSDFQKYTGKSAKVGVEVVATYHGSEIAGTRIIDLLGVPKHRITANNTMRYIEPPSFGPVDVNILEEDDGFYAKTFAYYDGIGLPVALMEARALAVSVEINGVSQSHQAIELCWASQGYCTVLDPVMPSLVSSVRGIRKHLATGYYDKIELSADSGDRAKASCEFTFDGTSTSLVRQRTKTSEIAYRSDGTTRGATIYYGYWKYSINCRLLSNNSCDAVPSIIDAQPSTATKHVSWWSVNCPGNPASDAVNGSGTSWGQFNRAVAYVYTGCRVSNSATLTATSGWSYADRGQLSSEVTFTGNGSIAKLDGNKSNVVCN